MDFAHLQKIMKRAADALLAQQTCSPEDKTSEEMDEQLLEDSSGPIDVKTKISHGSYFLPKELDVMILERVNATDLKQVAQVKRTWRSYIATNELRMRACIVDYIRITLSVKLPGEYVYGKSLRGPFKVLKLKDSIPAHDRKEREQRITFSQLIYYQPQGFLKLETCRKLLIPNPSKLCKKQLKQIKSLPDWWFRRVKKVQCSLEDRRHLRAIITECFEHLNELCVCIDSNSVKLKHLTDFIRMAPKTDSFTIRVGYGINHLLVDEMLEAVIKKSFDHPTEFPTFVGKSTFTIAKIIHFLETNLFSNEPIHRIHIFSPVIGTLEEWNEWLRCNANQLQYFHLNAYAENLLADGRTYAIEKVTNSRWKFQFRGEYFDVILESFVASPVL